MTTQQIQEEQHETQPFIAPSNTPIAPLANGVTAFWLRATPSTARCEASVTVPPPTTTFHHHHTITTTLPFSTTHSPPTTPTRQP